MKKTFKVSAETKEQILKRIKEESLPVSRIAEEHGISPNTIYGADTCAVRETVMRHKIALKEAIL